MIFSLVLSVIYGLRITKFNSEFMAIYLKHLKI